MSDPLFRRIRSLANEACEAAQAMSAPQRAEMGAVNWSDLRSGEVLRCENEAGAVSWCVEIGEASPGCALALYVHEFIMREAPGIVLDVRAEW